MFKFDVPIILMVFFAITVISVGSVVLPLWNYTRYYLALWNFDYVLSSVTIDASQIEAIKINVTLLLLNPTDYSGLEVSSIKVGMQYFGARHEVPVPAGARGIQMVPSYLWDLKIGSTDEVHPLGSNSNETVLLTVVVNPNSNILAERNSAQEFMNFVSDKYRTQIMWYLNCVLVLSSFLGGFDVTRYFSPDKSPECVTYKINDVYWASPST